MKKIIKKEKFVFYRSEGTAIPRFYLPVRWILATGELECWIFILAPFVWLFYTAKIIIRTLARECVDWLKLLEQKLRGFKNS